MFITAVVGLRLIVIAGWRDLVVCFLKGSAPDVTGGSDNKKALTPPGSETIGLLRQTDDYVCFDLGQATCVSLRIYFGAKAE